MEGLALGFCVSLAHTDHLTHGWCFQVMSNNSRERHLVHLPLIVPSPLLLFSILPYPLFPAIESLVASLLPLESFHPQLIDTSHSTVLVFHLGLEKQPTSSQASESSRIMAFTASSWVLACFIIVLVFAHPTHAFGAGNIGSTSEAEGQNWRHGDIEDTLLTILISRAAGGKKFSKLDVKRVYFGNWLRDYSQAVDVGTVKYVSAEAIRILLWVLGFLSFGYGTNEFEVTTQRLGCYRPEEHIDNPKDYADNEDARQYDRRLRGPVDERRELAIDPQTGTLFPRSLSRATPNIIM
jgi:hypothetical protein